MRRRNPKTQVPILEVNEWSESNAPKASAIKSESTGGPAKPDSANVYGWPYRGPAWLAEMLALDVRSIALFRALVGSISLWDVCHDYLPDAQWFLHDSGYSVSIVHSGERRKRS